MRGEERSRRGSSAAGATAERCCCVPGAAAASRCCARTWHCVEASLASSGRGGASCPLGTAGPAAAAAGPAACLAAPAMSAAAGRAEQVLRVDWCGRRGRAGAGHPVVQQDAPVRAARCTRATGLRQSCLLLQRAAQASGHRPHRAAVRLTVRRLHIGERAWLVVHTASCWPPAAPGARPPGLGHNSGRCGAWRGFSAARGQAEPVGAGRGCCAPGRTRRSQSDNASPSSRQQADRMAQRPARDCCCCCVLPPAPAADLVRTDGSIFVRNPTDTEWEAWRSAPDGHPGCGDWAVAASWPCAQQATPGFEAPERNLRKCGAFRAQAQAKLPHERQRNWLHSSSTVRERRKKQFPWILLEWEAVQGAATCRSMDQRIK